MSSNQKTQENRARVPVIVLTGGGSGGHITPLLSLAHALKKKDPSVSITYIGHKGDKFDTLQERYHDFDFVAFINGGKFRRYHGESVIKQLLDIKTLLLNIRDFFRLIGSIGKSIKILRKIKPDVVLSKGGFVGVPVGIAARFLRVPIVTHDSDAVPGLANKIIGRWAVIHATGMPAEFYNYPKESTKYVGIPLDYRIKHVSSDDKKDFKKQLGINVSNQVLLVSGGGLGSRNVNEKVIKIAPDLLSKHPHLHIVHITGVANEEEVKEKYAKALKDSSNPRVTILGFTSDFYKYAGAADLIVARAGATTLAEHALQGKACILIPSPFLTGGHQVKNAEELKKVGAVEIVENDAAPGVLFRKIEALLKDDSRRKELGDNLHKNAKSNAAGELASILLDIVNKK